MSKTADQHQHGGSPAPIPSGPPAGADPPEVMARIRECLDLVDIAARQYARRVGAHVPLGDIASYGHEGLLLAARTYKEDRGPFRRWANLRISGAILDGLRAMGDLPRHVYRRLRAIEAGEAVQEALLEEHAAAPATSAEDADKRLHTYLRGMATAMAMGVVGGRGQGEVDAIPDGAAGPEEQAETAELTRVVQDLLTARPHEEQTLIRRVYFEGATLEQAGKELGLSRSWSSRLHARAIDAIARALGAE